MAWEIDTSHSLVEFAVKHMMVTTVKGRFTQFSGDFTLDENDPIHSSVDVTIQTASITTGADPRDNHLRGADFFDAEKYPTITYRSREIHSTGRDHYRVLGDLSVHGVTREVPLEVSFEGHTKNMQGKRLAAFSAHTSISRKDFGLEWNVALESGGWLVGDKVNIAIEAEVLEKEAAANQVA